jgi:DNA-binding response OmpR family regulator
MKNRILLVEDDDVLGETLKDFFEDNELSVAWAQDGNAALELFESFKPQLILLDIILPEKDGFEVIREIRKTNSIIPIIIMTGTQLEYSDQIKGFDLGAVNYLSKPVVPQVVLAQIKNQLSHINSRKFKLEQFDITIDNQLLTINNTEILLKDKESKLLLLLLNNKHNIISRDYIMQAIWSDDAFNMNNTLDSTISHLKKKLIDFPTIKITSAYGTGYRLIVI